jgi:tetratricopeptide (TPR) repeat protein
MYILSGVLFQQGEHEEHEQLLTKALSIQRRHPDEGNNLPYMMVDYASSLLLFRDDYAGALALDREALEDFRRRYGENHYMVSETEAKLIRDYSDLGDYAQAEALAQSYLKQSRSSGPAVLANLATIQIYRGEYAAAENSIRQMLARAQSESWKPEWLALAQDVQYEWAYQQGSYAQAKAYLEKALALLPADSATHPFHVCSLALILIKLGDAKRAEILLRPEIARLKQSERVFDLAILKSALGESLAAQRRFAEAETVLLEAYETEKARVLPGQYELNETRRRLADLYRAWGKPGEAAKYL